MRTSVKLQKRAHSLPTSLVRAPPPRSIMLSDDAAKYWNQLDPCGHLVCRQVCRNAMINLLQRVPLIVVHSLNA
jgi:hypothetical protein